MRGGALGGNGGLLEGEEREEREGKGENKGEGV